MLRTLELRDFALVDDLAIELGPGLNVLTGETGAGKSLVIDALELLAGGRADASLIRAGAESALVQGEFEGAGPTSASRRLTQSGRHTARLDGELVSVAELAECCGARIAVFAQHGAAALQAPAAQRAQLDALLRPAERAVLERHQDAFRRHADAVSRLAEMQAAQREKARRVDTLNHQLDEIGRVRPVADEDERLAVELDTLRHAERIVTAAAGAYTALTEAEPSAVSLADEARRQLQNAARHAPDLANLASELADAVGALGAIAGEVESFLAAFDTEPGRLDEVQHRLALLDDLKRKYGPDLAGVLAFAQHAATELAALGRLDDDLGALSAETAALEEELALLGTDLTAARQDAAVRLARAVTPLLQRLGMTHATFEARLAPAARRSAHGVDAVEFAFSANLGEAPGPLAAIASGGELSRAMLALHLVTGTTHGTVAFDEIDAGVGGAAARDVGALLAALARDHQVLVVTHLAQVAAFADAHYVVAKEPVAGRTVTSVTRLDDDTRPAELARMLSGSVTQASLTHASELLADARSAEAHERLARVE